MNLSEKNKNTLLIRLHQLIEENADKTVNSIYLEIGRKVQEVD